MRGRERSTEAAASVRKSGNGVKNMRMRGIMGGVGTNVRSKCDSGARRESSVLSPAGRLFHKPMTPRLSESINCFGAVYKVILPNALVGPAPMHDAGVEPPYQG